MTTIAQHRTGLARFLGSYMTEWWSRVLDDDGTVTELSDCIVLQEQVCELLKKRELNTDGNAAPVFTFTVEDVAAAINALDTAVREFVVEALEEWLEEIDGGDELLEELTDAGL